MEIYPEPRSTRLSALDTQRTFQDSEQRTNYKRQFTQQTVFRSQPQEKRETHILTYGSRVRIYKQTPTKNGNLLVLNAEGHVEQTIGAKICSEDAFDPISSGREGRSLNR